METLANLSTRLNKVDVEYKLAQRNKVEQANRAYKALSMITDEQVELLKGVVPAIAIIKTYTVDDIMKNKHGESALIAEVRDALTKLAEERITFYEGQL